MDVKTVILKIVCIYVVLTPVESFSRTPSEFVNSTWYSNVHGEIEFTSTEMSGWSVNLNGTATVSWIWLDDTRYTENGGFVIFRSARNYTINGTQFYAYMCTNLNKITDNLYRYYNLHPPESRFGGERVALWEASCLERFEHMCTDLSFVPNPDDIHIMARKGGSMYRTCPEQLIAKIGFTAQTTDTTDLCVGVTYELDGCSDNSKIQINSACGYPLVFSANGTLSCLTEQASGSDGIIYLLNRDNTVDNVKTFRFSCMAISGDGTILSIVPQRCLVGHNSSTFPSSKTGQRLFAKTRAVCTTYVTKVYDETRSLWIRIGIPVAVVLLFVILFILCASVSCMRVRRKQVRMEKEIHHVKHRPDDERRIVVLQQPYPKHLRAIT